MRRHFGLCLPQIRPAVTILQFYGDYSTWLGKVVLNSASTQPGCSTRTTLNIRLLNN